MEYTGDMASGFQGHLALYDLSTGQPLNVTNPLPATWAVGPKAWLGEHTLLLFGWNGQQAAAVIWDFQGAGAPTSVPGMFLGVVR